MGLFTLLSLFLISNSYSTSAPVGAKCEVKGIIVDVSEREYYYGPESWRVSWSLPKSTQYIDVKLNISLVKEIEKGFGECTKEELEGLSGKFQLRDHADKSKLKVNSCIKAMTQKSGDEFRIGQWLWDIVPCK